MSREDNHQITPRLPSNEEDPVERRRLLNILAQRRYRQRKRSRLVELEAQAQANSEQAGPSSSTRQDQNYLPISSQDFPTFPGSSEDNAPFVGASLADFSTLPAPELPETFGHLGVDAPALRSDSESSLLVSPSLGFEDFMSQFPSQSSQPSSQHLTPFPPMLRLNPRLSFSTSTFAQADRPNAAFADCLITTPGVNCIRAHVEIFKVMHGQDFKVDIWNPLALSPFTILNINLNASTACTHPHLPADFHPTKLQRVIQHHPVLDVLPWPSFRDKFLYVLTLPDEFRPPIAQGDMPSVMMQFMSIMKDAGGGLRVWGSNPFAKDAWEVGQLFYSKFWWAIDTEIVVSSNKLRLRRGEDVLKVRVQEL